MWSSSWVLRIPSPPVGSHPRRSLGELLARCCGRSRIGQLLIESVGTTLHAVEPGLNEKLEPFKSGLFWARSVELVEVGEIPLNRSPERDRHGPKSDELGLLLEEGLERMPKHIGSIPQPLSPNVTIQDLQHLIRDAEAHQGGRAAHGSTLIVREPHSISMYSF